MPIYKLLSEMPYEEFVSWNLYFESRPLGWREDIRTYHLLRAQGEKAKPEKVFPSLAGLFKPRAGMESLKGSAMYANMLKAKGGDRLDFL